MSLKLYNTLTRKEEVFQPINAGQVAIYACGPTVYNYVHIGNWRTFLFTDTLVRSLEYLGYQVKLVMNLTDIDDKIIRRAREQKMSITEFTQIYTDIFFAGIKTLNIRPADVYPKATDHIKEMVELVEGLIKNGTAYIADGSVFFSVNKFAGYGDLAHLDLDKAKSAAKHRVTNDEYEKDDISDFCLWKAYKAEEDGDVVWDAPFGRGRPGWHLECSAMSMKHLSPTFDIHTGGVDLIFPHHTNEIAQSCGFSHQPFVNYWVHSEHLVMMAPDGDEAKMSKSLGNIVNLNTLLDEGWSAAVIRLALISANYRSKLKFSPKILEQAKANLDRVQSFYTQLQKRVQDQATGDFPDSELQNNLQTQEDKFRSSIEDNLNIPEALSTIFNIMNYYNPQISRLNATQAKEIITCLQRWDKVFACLPVAEVENDSRIDALVQQRIQAKRDKNFKLADEIRAQLNEMGIIIEDSKDGATWRRRI